MLKKPEEKDYENRICDCQSCLVSVAIDEMDAYYKQFIKDNIPGRGELYNMIWNLHIQVAEVKDIKKLTKAIRKLIKERLDV